MPTDKPVDAELVESLPQELVDDEQLAADFEAAEAAAAAELGRPWFDHCVASHGAHFNAPESDVVYMHGANFPICTWHPGQPEPETETTS